MAGLAASLVPIPFLTAYFLTSLNSYLSQILTSTHRYSQILTSLHSSPVLSLLHPTLSYLQILSNTHTLPTGSHRVTSSLPFPFHQPIYISLFSPIAPHKSSHILTPQARLVIVAGLAFHLPPSTSIGSLSSQVHTPRHRHGSPLWLVPPLSYLRLFTTLGPANHCGWSRHLPLTTLLPLYQQ